MTTREEDYDRDVAPLVLELLERCKRLNIPFVFLAQIDEAHQRMHALGVEALTGEPADVKTSRRNVH